MSQRLSPSAWKQHGMTRTYAGEISPGVDLWVVIARNLAATERPHIPRPERPTCATCGCSLVDVDEDCPGCLAATGHRLPDPLAGRRPLQALVDELPLTDRQVDYLIEKELIDVEYRSQSTGELREPGQGTRRYITDDEALVLEVYAALTSLTSALDETIGASTVLACRGELQHGPLRIQVVS